MSTDLACPRCSQPLDQEHYGPCPPCRTELRSTLGGPARDVEVDSYDPKMNVTPNSVASKD